MRGECDLKRLRNVCSVGLAFCMLFATTACTDKSEQSKEWREPAAEETVAQVFTDTDGEFEYETKQWEGPVGYTLIYPSGDSDAEKYAEILQEYYKEASEIEIPIKADSQAENEKEILIGATNRAESSGDISESDIEVSLKNKKLVFKGGHNVTLKSAVEKFVRLKPENKQAFTYKISTDFKSTALDNYTYVWGDEFEGSDLDFTKWDFEDRMGSTTKIETAWDKEVINVEDGRLKLHAINYFDPMREGTMYKVPYSVVTKYKMNYTYGYVEIRARVPLYKGSWPSFWGLSLNGQGGTYSDKGLMYNKAKSDKKLYGVEVDIFEVFGSKAITPNVHKWYRANNYAYDEIHNVQTSNHTELTSKDVWDWAVKSENPDNASNEYHTYGFEWTSKEMSFYVDGNKYYTLDITKSYDLCEDMSGFHDAIYLMFNNHVFADDQSWYQNLIEDHTQMPFCFYIDYIRLYQQKNVGRLTIDETPKEYSGR